jgi:ribosomal-protein-alanine N-acetyltransferase
MADMTTSLQTDRLILRRFDWDDLDRMSELMANPGFMRFSLGVYSRERTEEFLRKVIGWDNCGIPSLFAVILNNQLLGYCGFYHPEGFEDTEIGYRFDPQFWNQGFATEAARAVRDCGFSDWKLDRLISLIHPDNVPSRRVAEKNGMTLARETTFKGFPTQVFAISLEQWMAGRGG